MSVTKLRNASRSPSAICRRTPASLGRMTTVLRHLSRRVDAGSVVSWVIDLLVGCPVNIVGKDSSQRARTDEPRLHSATSRTFVTAHSGHPSFTSAANTPQPGEYPIVRRGAGGGHGQGQERSCHRDRD